MKVLLYGPLADAIGAQADVQISEGCSIAELREKLIDTHPAATADLRRSRAIVGRDAVGSDYRPGVSEVVEFLPPVSGG